MLPLYLVQEIKCLLDEGRVSQREIARRLGVGRGTVGAIALGRRGLHGRETPNIADQPDEPPQRCGGCGMLVMMPCVYCLAQEYAGRRKRFESGNLPNPQPQAA